MLAESKSLQVVWMVVPPMGESCSSPSSPQGPVPNISIPQGAGLGQAQTCPALAGSQPPLIANPPSQPLIIPSHVANALLLTR